MDSKANRVSFLKQIKMQLKNISDEDIEQGIVQYFQNKLNKKNTNNVVSNYLSMFDFPYEVEYVIEFFEMLVNKETANENGIVFTPKYIAEYIVEKTLSDLLYWKEDIVILDSGCGCGIFLVAAAKYIHKRFSVPINQILKKNIYGFDIDKNNIRRCKIVLSMLCSQYGCEIEECNVFCCDSLKSDWKNYGINTVDYIIGNPPYVNPHNLKKETVSFLKKNYLTTKTGIFNIFYAFIENGMKYLSKTGTLGFIVPNNFLTIKSASNLRNFLQKNRYIKSILDFGDNMVFKPVRTYNCIIQLDKKENTEFDYFVMETCNNISDRLYNINFHTMKTDTLDNNGWKLADEKTHKNIVKIESQEMPIKAFIRTGIATLKDSVYIIDSYTADNKYFPIETEIIKPIYKIPELKLYGKLEDARKNIIFPYQKYNGKFVLIPEDKMKKQFPKAYQYLLSKKNELDRRDNGKKNPAGWYAYGRTQGLNKYGKKLLFPTFSNKPKFTYIDDEYALFCNGYAVFENDFIELEILCKILNSKIMEYYISQTSYTIEGGYYCYQKKYIERFSIPKLTVSEIEKLKKMSQEHVNQFLIHKYDIKIQ